jgi:glycyl-tRNA synthetase
VFPLLKNKPELVEKAREIYSSLKKNFNTSWDDRGNIGKRYFAQDEIGTPWCVTVDFQSLDDSTVTIRERDTAKQQRVSIDKLTEYFQNELE